MKQFLLLASIAIMLFVMVRGHLDLFLPSVLLVLGGILINNSKHTK